MREILLDAREMKHPQPLETAIEILKKLDNESMLYMVHRKNPVPLIELAKAQGFNLLNKEIKTKECHILIAKNHTVNLSEYLHV